MERIAKILSSFLTVSNCNDLNHISLAGEFICPYHLAKKSKFKNEDFCKKSVILRLQQ
jgi:hypothetical protein